MISIQLNRTGDYFQVIANGHAGTDEYGKDLVCCAVSTLLVSFSRYCRINDKAYRNEIGSGNANIIVHDPDGSSLSAQQMLTEGLKMLEIGAPEAVKIMVGEIINVNSYNKINDEKSDTSERNDE